MKLGDSIWGTAEIGQLQPIKRCPRCNRILKSKKSLEIGYGPVCYQKELAEAARGKG